MTKKKFINPTNVKYIDLIWWQDAYTSSGENPEFDEEENIWTLSIGVIVSENKEFIHMSHFYDGISKELMEPFTSVPVGMVKNRRRIKL